MSQNISHRLGFKFWLNMDKADEEVIADQIEVLKNERSFTQTIRDGIRLVCDLRNGKLDVLFELFPWVRAEFMQYMRDLQLQPVTDMISTHPVPSIEPHATETQQAWLDAEQERFESERKWQEKRLKDAEKALEAERRKLESERTQAQKQMQTQLDRLEQLLLQQGNLPISGGLQAVGGGGDSPSQNGSGPKPLAIKQFNTPTFDDDDDFILDVKKDESSGARAAQNFINSIQQLTQ